MTTTDAHPLDALVMEAWEELRAAVAKTKTEGLDGADELAQAIDLAAEVIDVAILFGVGAGYGAGLEDGRRGG